MDQQDTSVEELARNTGGTLIGDPATVITGAAPHYEAGPGQITLVDGVRLDGLELRASAIVAGEPVPSCPLPQIVVADPREAFARIVESFLPPQPPELVGIDPAARVHPTAQLGRGCVVEAGVVIGRHVHIGARAHIMAGAVIMNHTRIGDDCVIYPNVTLYDRTRLEDRVTIHANSVLGAFGFGYRQEQGQHVRTAQLGYVLVENDVEIGACVTIDRGTYGSTRIGAGTKIDNQVMIAHNCQIGRHNLLCSQVGIAGSCTTGEYVVLAGQVGLKDHIHLGDRAVVAAQSGVMADLPGDQVYLGSPATTQREQMQIMAIQRRLPEMRRVLKQVEQSLSRRDRAACDSDQAERAA